MLSSNNEGDWDHASSGTLRQHVFHNTSMRGKRNDSAGTGGPSRGNRSSVELRIPLNCVGAVIGRGGSKIKELQEQNGVRININRNDVDSLDRVHVEISSDDITNCDKAKSSILDLVSLSDAPVSRNGNSHSAWHQGDSRSSGQNSENRSGGQWRENEGSRSEERGSQRGGHFGSDQAIDERETSGGGQWRKGSQRGGHFGSDHAADERETSGGDQWRNNEGHWSGNRGGRRGRGGNFGSHRSFDERETSGGQWSGERGGQRGRRGNFNSNRSDERGWGQSNNNQSSESWSSRDTPDRGGFQGKSDCEGNGKPKLSWGDFIKNYNTSEQEKWSKAPRVAKDFYVEDEAVASMTSEEVDMLRRSSQNIVVESLAGTTMKDERDPDPDSNLTAENDVIPNPVRTFAEAFGGYPDIMREIENNGFVKPSPIQMQAWPVIMKGRDLIGIAQTGTGKTLAFLLPAFIHIEGQAVPREERRGPTALVLTPTRELALQIEEEVKKYKYHGIRCVCIYGGGNRREQIDVVMKGVEIVVATPGRLNDLIYNGHLFMDCVSYVVLDEADRMLDLGFEPEIHKALSEVRPGRQTVMTSATWPECVRRLAFKYMKDPIQVFVGSLDLTAVHSVEQRIIIMDVADKYKELKALLSQEISGDCKAIVFMTRKSTVNHVASTLVVEGDCYCASITGDREQIDREQAIDDIKTGRVKVLIATDVASRGIDIKDVTHVINYDFPKNIEEYVHRIGRTGRAGRTGLAITFITRDDWRHASELIRIMEEAQQPVPEELYNMKERFSQMKERRSNDRGSFRGSRGRGGRRGQRSEQGDNCGFFF